MGRIGATTGEPMSSESSPPPDALTLVERDGGGALPLLGIRAGLVTGRSPVLPGELGEARTRGEAEAPGPAGRPPTEMFRRAHLLRTDEPFRVVMRARQLELVI